MSEQGGLRFKDTRLPFPLGPSSLLAAPSNSCYLEHEPGCGAERLIKYTARENDADIDRLLPIPAVTGLGGSVGNFTGGVSEQELLSISCRASTFFHASDQVCS